MVTRTLKKVFTIGSDVTVNSGDFGNGTAALSLTFHGTHSNLDVEDATAALDNDVARSETSDDPSQVISGTATPIFVEDELVFKDAAGNTYTFYSLDTGRGATNTDGAYLLFKSSSTGNLPPDGTTLTYVSELGNTVATYPCFLRGTVIDTARGPVLVEDLRQGDLIVTLGHGLQPIRWIGQRHLSHADLATNAALRPVRIARHALGDGSPSADLLVSPQHRVLIASKIAQRMFGVDEILVAAKQLCGLAGISIAQEATEASYVHFLLDRHEVVFSNGARTESLFTGPEALLAVGPDAAAEILTLFPQLHDLDHRPRPARPLITGKQGRKLALRHSQNHKSLIGQGAGATGP